MGRVEPSSNETSETRADHVAAAARGGATFPGSSA
jgi:hypothetical protein